MPTYEYACTECGKHLEVVQSFTDDSLTECPSCQGRLRKIFGNVGVTFKGSGFYKTDSRGSSSPSPTSDSAPSSTAADSSSTPSAPASPDKASSAPSSSDSKPSDSKAS